MGGATVIHYMGRKDLGKHRDFVKIVVLDSPYAKLKLVVKNKAYNSWFLSKFAKIGLYFINKVTKRRGGLDILKFKPEKFAAQCTHEVSVMFLHGE